MSAHEDGGPAFPRNPHSGEPSDDGMSLLDYFAAKVLAGLCANPGGPFQANDMSGWSIVNCTTDQLAEQCYEMAEAMLKKARSRT